MDNTSLFKATTICLTALDAKEDAATIAGWTQDGRYIPLSDSAPAHPQSPGQVKKLLEERLKESDQRRNTFWFGIRTADESELLGITGLGWVDWSNSAAYLGINMKDLAEYGRPSTVEALALILRYAFHELQMHRLSLIATGYNEGLIAVIRSIGFIEEVRRREATYRFGRRWDMSNFGLLAADWRKGLADE